MTTDRKTPKQPGKNASTSAAAKRITPAKPKAPNRVKPVNPALDTHEERLKVAAKSAARTKRESARMPDKKPDNWEVHQTGTQAEFGAAVDAALGSRKDAPYGRNEAGVPYTTDPKREARNSPAEDVEDWLATPHERDIVTTEVQPARAFRDQTFANANIGLISDYADYRVMGWNPERAFIRVFGTDYGDVHLFARIEALEHNIVYRQVFAKRFGATPLSRMFSVKHAIWHWLSLLNNPFVRETVRAKAIESLQVIYGITVVDEAGNTKATKTLDDFYREETANGSYESNPQAFRHPDPGSAEAIAFEEKMRGTSTGENTAGA